jgi:hypothetical protein
MYSFLCASWQRCLDGICICGDWTFFPGTPLFLSHMKVNTRKTFALFQNVMTIKMSDQGVPLSHLSIYTLSAALCVRERQRETERDRLQGVPLSHLSIYILSAALCVRERQRQRETDYRDSHCLIYLSIPRLLLSV